MAKDNETSSLEWQAPEFRHYPKSAAWYVLAVIVAAGLVVWQAFTQDYFGAMTTAILGLLAILYAKRRPDMLTVRLDHSGITLNDKNIPFRHFLHFWIVNTREHKTLNLEANTYLRQTVIIELENQDPEQIRKLIKRHLTEAEHNKPAFSQALAHKFRF